MSWLDRFIGKSTLNKKALEKLPEAELQGSFPPFTDGPGGPPGSDPMQDPALMGGAPPAGSQPPLDPSMGMPEEPLVWNNNYLVKPIADGPEFIVQFTPSIVNKPQMPVSAPGMPAGPTDPMQDPTLNPNADPNQLSQWMNQQNDGNDKPYPGAEQDPLTEDPLSKQEEANPAIEDTGNEKNPKVNVHKKAATYDPGFNRPLKTPGADQSNAYMPCAVCANYIAADNDCAQGLDVEKVQAAKSCSWLNSNFSAFDVKDNTEQGHQDKDTVKNDVSDISGGGGGGGSTSKFASKDKGLIEYLKKLW